MLPRWQTVIERCATSAGAAVGPREITQSRQQQEILRDLLRTGHSPVAGQDAGMEKVVAREALGHELDSRRRLSQRVVFTNGCFDVLHAGHVQYLQEARAQGDLLVVGLNSDASVRALKGPGRPVNPIEARATVLSALEAVDVLALFDEATPLELIQAGRPDVLVKGADSGAYSTLTLPTI